MPILPAGKIKTRSQQAGFTLVEILVVLLIVGLMAGAVVMNMPAREDPWHQQGRLMAGRMELAAQTSMIDQKPMGISFTDDGYEIVRYSREIWELVAEYSYDLTPRPVVELEQNGAKIDIKAAEEAGIPVIRYDSTGLATPFELSIDTGTRKLQFSGKVNGDVVLDLDGER